MISPPLICFSVTEEESAQLVANGPRRDILMLAERCGGKILYRRPGGLRQGLRARVFGPQLGHAWAAAAETERGGKVFADGEHVGFPLAAFLAFRFKRNVQLTVLGHYVTKRWKRYLLWIATRCVARGTLVVHSQTQAEAVRKLLPLGWTVTLLPYQVDASFWMGAAETQVRPLVVAAGSEHRDYQTLIDAVRDLDIDVCIASGSHWARTQAVGAELPPNVQFFTQTLPFAALRDLYARATVVVVPLFPVKNQSGITTVLEAMSMAKPVIVSATPGQTEAVTGGVFRAEGPAEPTNRGPQLLDLPRDPGETGIYVCPEDAEALRRALNSVLQDPDRAQRMGVDARASVLRNFTVEQFAERFAQVVLGIEDGPRSVIPEAALL